MKLRVEVDKHSLTELDKMPSRLREGVSEAMERLLDKALDEVKAAAPVRSGKTRDSFSTEVKTTSGGIAGYVQSDWFVARLQNYGYSAHYHYLPNGRRVFVPGKPLRKPPHGYYVEPAVERALERSREELERLVERL